MMRRLNSRTCAIYVYVLFTKKQRQRQRQRIQLNLIGKFDDAKTKQLVWQCAVDLRIINKESDQIIINNNKILTPIMNIEIHYNPL